MRKASAVRGYEMAKDRKSLDQLTKEDYQKALSEIQGALAACVGDLIILGGYLDSDFRSIPRTRTTAHGGKGYRPGRLLRL